jgi:hypothetical protein
MPSTTTGLGITVWTLPPLILHPFNENVTPQALLDNSRAALMLSGLIAGDGSDPEVLRRKLLAGRYAEIRMLFFLGKDLLRWIGQCVELAQRIPELQAVAVRAQSFAELLIECPPARVKEKLLNWGVGDYNAIFSRALALNALFIAPPPFDLLSEELLHHGNRFADQLYRCYLESEPHAVLTAANFDFELYASGEYAKLLEAEWEGK